MRYCPQALLWYQFATDTVNTVGLVLNTDKGTFQTLDELLLAIGQLYKFFLTLSSTTLLQHLIRWRCVITVITIGVHQLSHHLVVVSTGKSQFLVDNFLELLEFLIRITCLFFPSSCFLVFYV